MFLHCKLWIQYIKLYDRICYKDKVKAKTERNINTCRNTFANEFCKSWKKSAHRYSRTWSKVVMSATNGIGPRHVHSLHTLMFLIKYWNINLYLHHVEEHRCHPFLLHCSIGTFADADLKEYYHLFLSHVIHINVFYANSFIIILYKWLTP